MLHNTRRLSISNQKSITYMKCAARILTQYSKNNGFVPFMTHCSTYLFFLWMCLVCSPLFCLWIRVGKSIFSPWEYGVRGKRKRYSPSAALQRRSHMCRPLSGTTSSCLPWNALPLQAVESRVHSFRGAIFLQTRIAIPRYFSQSYGAYFKYIIHVHTRTVNVCAMLMISYVILKYAPYDWLKCNPRLQKKKNRRPAGAGIDWSPVFILLRPQSVTSDLQVRTGGRNTRQARCACAHACGVQCRGMDYSRLAHFM